MESRADLEQGAHASAYPRLAQGGRGDAGQDLQQGALACAVVADDPEGFAALHFEVEVPQGPELAGRRASPQPLDPLGDALGEQLVAAPIGTDLEALAEALHLDDEVAAHTTSAKYCSVRR